MRECIRCGKTEEDSVNHRVLDPCLLCTEYLDEFTPRLEDALALFCVERQEGLRINQFKTYLKERRWKEIVIQRKEVVRFESPPTKRIYIELPARIGLMDSAYLFKSVLKTLSLYEERDVYEIMNDICACV